MDIKNVLLTAVVTVNLYFAVVLIRDFLRYKQSIMQESADARILPFSSFGIFLLSTFGISDYAISSAAYPKLGWLPIKKLPGTLNAQCETFAKFHFAQIFPTVEKSIY